MADELENVGADSGTDNQEQPENKPKQSKKNQRKKTGHKRLDSEGKEIDSYYKKAPIGTDQDRARMILISNMAQISNWIVEENLTIQEICNRLGVSRNAVYSVRQQIPEFETMLEQARDAFIDRIENSAYKQCFDREIEAEKVLPTGKKVKYKKVVTASDAMIKFMLLNKRPEEYKERQELTVSKKEFIVDIVEADGYTVVDIEQAKEGQNTETEQK